MADYLPLQLERLPGAGVEIRQHLALGYCVLGELYGEKEMKKKKTRMESTRERMGWEGGASATATKNERTEKEDQKSHTVRFIKAGGDTYNVSGQERRALCEIGSVERVGEELVLHVSGEEGSPEVK